MTSTLIFDAYEAFLALIRTAIPGRVVYDGPATAYPTESSYIVFGTADPTTDGWHTAIETAVQDWHDLGTDRLETFVIVATVVAWSGDGDFGPIRAAAEADVQAIGAALRPPPHGTGDAMLGNTLNQAGNGTGWCGYTVTGLRQINNNDGMAVHVPIALACTALV